MNLTKFAIKRPAAMTIIILFFVVMGLLGYSRLSADLYPRVNIPFVTVFVAYPGAGAKEIETQVVKPIEEAVSSLPKIKRTTSTSSEGRGVVVVEFEMTANTDLAAIDVQKKVDGIAGILPRDTETPVVNKFDFNAQPIITLALSGSLPREQTYLVAKDTVKERVQKVAGVAEVTIMGGKEREIQVKVDRYKLDTYGLSVNQILARILLENQNVPLGRLEEGKRELVVRMVGEFNDLTDLAKLQIPLPAGGTIRLQDVAEISDSFKDMQVYGRLNGLDAIGVVIQKQSDASIVTTADLVKKEAEKIRREMPPGVDLVIASDTSKFIRSALDNTMENLLEAVLMTSLVLFLFLREWRSLFIVLLAIPTSIISTFMMMYLLDFSLNIVSLTGLTVCVGILVDDSIVILENIYRHLQIGKTPWQAALDGRREIGLAAVAITLSDVVIFLPIAFLSGMVGQFFRQFGLTVVCATLFSLFVSFTLTPMLASRLLAGGEREGRQKTSLLTAIARIGSRVAGSLTTWTVPLGYKTLAVYQRSLNWALMHRRTVVAAYLAVIMAAFALIPLKAIGTEFLARTDQGQFTINIELPPGTSLDETDRFLRQLDEKINTLPEVEFAFTAVGYGQTGSGSEVASHAGSVTVALTPKSERKRSVWALADQVRSWAAEIPGARIMVQEAALIGTRTEAPLLVDISGNDEAQLTQLAGQVMTIVRQTPGTADVDTSWRLGLPEMQVGIDRLRAAGYDLSVYDISRTMRASLDGEVAGKFRDGNTETDIRVQVAGIDKHPQDLERLFVANNQGVLVPVNAVADITEGTGPTTINRKDRQRLVTVSANLKGRPLGDVKNDLERQLNSLPLPPGCQINLSGESEDMDEAFRDLLFALGLSILLVYMILVILYESFLIPFIRMFTTPLGIAGGLLALWLTGHTINMMSLIGIIMLDGLAGKNGTLLIDYTNTLMDRGKPLREALVEAAATRLRPIFMTSFTMMFGMLPTALALSEGAEIRVSMAIVLIGGLVATTLFTLLVIPVVYTLIDDFRQWLYKKTGHKPRRRLTDADLLPGKIG